MWSRVVPLSLLLLAAFAAPVSAAEADLDVTGGLPLRGAGSAAVGSADATLVVRSTAGTMDAGLAAARLDVVAVEYWQEHRDGPVGGARGVRTTDLVFHDAELSITERLDGFTLVTWGDAATESTVAGVAPAAAEDPSWQADPDLRVFRLGAALPISAPVPDDAVDAALRDQVFGKPVPFHHEVPAGRLHLQAPTAAHATTGDLEGYLSGATITIQHADGLQRLVASERIEVRPGSVYVPGEGWQGPGTHEERVVRYLQWQASGAALTLRSEDVPVALFADRLDVALQGHLAIPSAVGSVRFSDDDVRTVETDRLLVSGAVTGTVAEDQDAQRAQVQGNGDVTYLRIGDQAESFGVAGAAAAAAGLAVIAALGFALWQHGGLVAPLFSRVAKGDVLDHDKRAELYEAVKQDPGVSPQELVERAGVGWSTVMYHLNVLERNEFVIAIRDGRYRRYFDRTTGQYANGRKQLVAALKNPTTAAVADYVRKNPGAVQRRLAERFGLAASSVHWHVRRLEDAGLVVKERRAQVVALLPGPGWARIDAAEAPGGPVASA